MKDPAFLFYPGDWLSGTMTFSRHHKGAYMDLLMAQFSQGHLSIDDIKVVLGNDFEHMWESKLKSKFDVDETGKFFNERLNIEKAKRKNFTASRKNNREPKEKNESHMNEHMTNHMNQHMENRNDNRNDNTITNENEIVIPFDAPEFLKIWNTLLIQPKWKKKTTHALQLALKKLSNYPLEIAIQMIENSIEGNYQGIFPINQNQKQTTQHDRDQQFISQSKFAR